MTGERATIFGSQSNLRWVECIAGSSERSQPPSYELLCDAKPQHLCAPIISPVSEDINHPPLFIRCVMIGDKWWMPSISDKVVTDKLLVTVKLIVLYCCAQLRCLLPLITQLYQWYLIPIALTPADKAYSNLSQLICLSQTESLFTHKVFTISLNEISKGM